MRAIDGDALMQALEKEKSDNLDAIVRFGMTKCIDIVRNAPAIEIRDNFDIGYAQGLEDGRNERPKGKWKFIKGDEMFLDSYKCTNCNEEFLFGEGIDIKHIRKYQHFCSNCGADMRKEKSS